MSEQEQNSPAEEQAKSEGATRIEDNEAEAIVGGMPGFEFANPDDPKNPDNNKDRNAPEPPGVEGILDGV